VRHVGENAGKMDLNEEEIIRGCKKKDARSQALLYRKYAPMLYGMALRYTQSESDAKDVLHDAFLKFFDNIKQYDGKGSFQAWMTRVVINKALSLHRRRSKMDNYDDYEDGIMDSSVVVSDTLTHEILLKFIQDLPDGYRTVFNLCEMEGYTYDEAAEMLNCAPSTCRSQLFKAKNTLRKWVDEFNKKEKQF